jgi:hypothetical protein
MPMEVDPGRMQPDVGHGQDDVLCEAAAALDAHACGVGAEVAASGEAVAAASADDVTFAADDLSGGEVGYVGADFYDFADELVADGEADGDGFAGPGVPFVDVEVGAADAGLEDADLDVVDADGWFRNVFEPQAAFRATLYQCLQRKPPVLGEIRPD